MPQTIAVQTPHALITLDILSVFVSMDLMELDTTAQKLMNASAITAAPMQHVIIIWVILIVHVIMDLLVMAIIVQITSQLIQARVKIVLLQSLQTPQAPLEQSRPLQLPLQLTPQLRALRKQPLK